MELAEKQTMKLAIKKEESRLSCAGYDYSLYPMPMTCEGSMAFFEQIGYTIVEVEAEEGARLISQARNALLHEVEIARMVELALSE